MLLLILGDGLARVTTLAKIAIVGRILSPHDFGLLAISIVVLRLIGNVTEAGLHTALVRKREDVRPYLDTLWTWQVIRGVAICALLFVAAPTAARFFRVPEAAAIIRAVGLVAVLFGFNNPAIVYLRKDLRFGAEVAWRSGAAVAGLVVAVWAAVVYRNVWALVASLIAAQVVELVTSYLIAPYRPRFSWDPAHLREFIGFGKWILLSSALAFFETNADTVLVGRLLGPTALAWYQLALQVAFVPASQLGGHVQGVLVPVFAKMRDSAAHGLSFQRAMSALLSLTVPCCGWLCVGAAPVVALVFGPRWLEAVPAVRILTLAGVGAAATRLSTALLETIGRPDVAAKMSLLRVGLLAGSLYPAVIAGGLSGAAWALSGTTVVVAALQVGTAAHLVGCRPRDMVSSLGPGLRASMPAALAAPGVLLGSPTWQWISLALAAAATAAMVWRDRARLVGVGSEPVVSST